MFIIPLIACTDIKHIVIPKNTIFNVDITMSYTQEYLVEGVQRPLFFDDFEMKVDQIKINNTLIKWYESAFDSLIDKDPKFHDLKEEGITLKAENILKAILVPVDAVHFHVKPTNDTTYDQRNLDEAACEFSIQEPIIFSTGKSMRFDLEKCNFCVKIDKDGNFIYNNLFLEDKNPFLLYVTKDILQQKVLLETNFGQFNKILADYPLKILPKQVDSLQFTMHFRLLNDMHFAN